MEFSDTNVVITGANGNLGKAARAAFAALGANVIGLDRHAGGEAGGQTLAVDLLDAAQVQAAIADIIGRHGHIDVLCNIAGAFDMGTPVHETSDAQWSAMYDANVRTLLNACRAVTPHMLSAGRGRIVNVGAASASRGIGTMGPYCAAKDAVQRITESMAAELRDAGIHVNAVLPSIIDTPQNRAAMPDADFSRWVEPAALADVMVFLASPGSRALHGACVPVTNRV